MADEDSEFVYVNLDRLGIERVTAHWLLLSGSLHHINGSASELSFRKVGTTNNFWAFGVPSATTTGLIQIPVSSYPILNYLDEIYFVAGAGTNGCWLKFLQFIPKKFEAPKFEKKGFWKHL